MGAREMGPYAYNLWWYYGGIDSDVFGSHEDTEIAACWLRYEDLEFVLHSV